MIVGKMTRNVKKKLAIFAGTSKCLVYAEAKYCASEMPGEIKYYECSRTEYCCAFGCCVSPGLHFHHLWYYWILVIIMFLVCSGGGWWYRYWLQGRYRAAASAIPNRSSNPRTQNPLRGPTCQAQQTRITYNSARNTVLLHRMWKGPQRNGAAPAYSSANGNATTSAQYQNMSVVLNDANCPYYQLYGPPPSYETVIAQSRGKISSNPASPEASARMTIQQTPNVITNPSVPQCFAYPCSPTPRLTANPDPASQCQNGAADSRVQLEHENRTFAHFAQYCVTNGTIRQNLCLPVYDYQNQQSGQQYDCFGRPYYGRRRRFIGQYADKSSDTSDAENSVPQRYELTSNGERYTIDRVGTSGRSQQRPDLPEISKVHGQSERASAGELGLADGSRGQRSDQEQETDSMMAAQEQEDRESRNDASDESDSQTTGAYSSLLAERYVDREVVYRDRRLCGGSLRLAGKYTDARGRKGMVQGQRDIAKASFSHDGSLERAAPRAGGSSQSNPSNNVILGSYVLDDDEDDDDDGGGGGGGCNGNGGSGSGVGRSEDATPLVGKFSVGDDRSPSGIGSTNSNLESKHRLDRSRSLE